MNDSKQKIAVLGASSFMARSFIQDSRTDFEYVVFGRSNVDQMQQFEYLDATKLDYKQMEKLIHFDVIINFIAEGVQSARNYKSDEIERVNTYFVIHLIEFLKENRFQGKLFTCGSYFEIGTAIQQEPIDEEQFKWISNLNEQTISDYITSKRKLTRYIYAHESGLNHYHLILPTVYGKTENEQRLIPYVISKIKTNEDLYVTSGNQTRMYLHVSDLTHLIYVMITKKILSAVYLVEGMETLTVNEIIAKILVKFPNYHGEIRKSVKRNDELMSYLCLNGEKLKTLANWTPSISIDNFLNEIIHE